MLCMCTHINKCQNMFLHPHIEKFTIQSTAHRGAYNMLCTNIVPGRSTNEWPGPPVSEKILASFLRGEGQNWDALRTYSNQTCKDTQYSLAYTQIMCSPCIPNLYIIYYLCFIYLCILSYYLCDMYIGGTYHVIYLPTFEYDGR